MSAKQRLIEEAKSKVLKLSVLWHRELEKVQFADAEPLVEAVKALRDLTECPVCDLKTGMIHMNCVMR